MICPQCGYDMGNKSKCVRCGCEVKELTVYDGDTHNDEQSQNSEKTETKIIDPCNVYLTHPFGYDDDFGTGFGAFTDPLTSFFGDIFGDPISDLLGGLFGIDLNPRRRTVIEDEPPKKKRKQGPIVEISDVEVIKDTEPSKEKKSSAANSNTTDTKSSNGNSAKKPNAKSHKNPFRRNGEK